MELGEVLLLLHSLQPVHHLLQLLGLEEQLLLVIPSLLHLPGEENQLLLLLVLPSLLLLQGQEEQLLLLQGQASLVMLLLLLPRLPQELQVQAMQPAGEVEGPTWHLGLQLQQREQQ